MEKNIHQVKQKFVEKIVKEISESNSLMILSIENLPSNQFQKIKKSLRKYGKVIVMKKNILQRIIKESKQEGILKLNDYIKQNPAIILSKQEGFDLAGIMSKEKTKIFARAGQISDKDIEIKAGPTNLLPGPAISELGNLGIQISIENGKISIKSSKIIVKKMQKITPQIASILQKLNIQPFTVELKPLVIYDLLKNKIYDDIDINSEEYLRKLNEEHFKSLGFAQKIIYYCKETIIYFLTKANLNAKIFDKTQLNESEEKD